MSNPIKIKILEVLEKHPNKWLKTKTIARELNLNTTEDINIVSVFLYRLRHLPYIERKRNSHAYQYRYYEEIKAHPTNILSFSERKRDKKAREKKDKFNGFTFVELLVEPRGGYCEICDKHTEITYKAEKNGCLFLLCEKHGKAIDKTLCGYGGLF